MVYMVPLRSLEILQREYDKVWGPPQQDILIETNAPARPSGKIVHAQGFGQRPSTAAKPVLVSKKPEPPVNLEGARLKEAETRRRQEAEAQRQRLQEIARAEFEAAQVLQREKAAQAQRDKEANAKKDFELSHGLIMKNPNFKLERRTEAANRLGFKLRAGTKNDKFLIFDHPESGEIVCTLNSGRKK